MGLDMYAFTVSSADAGDTQVDFARHDKDGNATCPQTEIAYWRKFNHLHGWMEALYREKGGTDETFNCNTVRLTTDDLFNLESDMQEKRLHPTEGFFFGDDVLHEDDLASLVLFIKNARAAIAEGKAVFYDSWW